MASETLITRGVFRYLVVLETTPNGVGDAPASVTGAHSSDRLSLPQGVARRVVIL
jgi:hypothetical protein